MSISTIFSWALAAVQSQAQKAAIVVVQKATDALNSAIQAHAPDYAALAQSAIQQAASHAIAGVLSRKI